MEIKNTFSKGSMNKDLDERLVPDGFYTDALNIRISNSSDGNIGAIENEKGNTKITGLSESDNLICIGAVADDPNEKIYWFVVDDNGKSAIYEYDNKNDVVTTVLKDERTGSSQVLNFDKEHKITGANVIFNRENNKNLLLFTDNLNPPRMVNIERAKGFGTDNFEEDDINLYKKPPRKAPTVVGILLPSDQNNEAKERFFAFSYRYKYLDGEYSALSAFTNYQFTPGIFELDFDTYVNLGMENIHNAYRITYNTGDKRVTDIQLCFTMPLTGKVFVIDTINKEQEALLNNIDKEYTFANKKIYRALPDDELNRLFDNVPLKALAQDIIEDRVIFGNYVSQYDLKENASDTSDIQIEYEADLRSSGLDGQEGTTAIVSGTSPANKTLKFTTTGFNFFKGNVFRLHVQVESAAQTIGGASTFDNDFPSSTTTIPVPLEVELENNYVDAAAFVAGSEFTTLLSQLNVYFLFYRTKNIPSGYTLQSSSTYFQLTGTPTSTEFRLNAPVLKYSSDDANATEQFTWVSAGSGYYFKTNTGSLSLKSNVSYQFGLVYLDKFGRYSSVIGNSGDLTSDRSVIFVPPMYASHVNTARITIKNFPPYWADRYKFFVKASRRVHYNIYANFYYEEDQFRWVLLNGNNLDKVEANQNLIIKQDINGPLANPIKTKVLEVRQWTGADVVESSEGWLIGNTDDGGQVIKEIQGTYMKILARDFSMATGTHVFKSYSAYDSNNVVQFGDLKCFLEGNNEREGILQDRGSDATSDAFDDDANQLDLPVNSKVTINFKRSQRSNGNADLRNYGFRRTYTVKQTYTPTSTLTFERNPLYQFLSNESGFTFNSSTSEFEIDSNIGADVSNAFQLKFENDTDQAKGNRHRIKVTAAGRGSNYAPTANLSATITILRQAGTVVFEVEPKEQDEDFYYETEEVFDITGGKHQGDVQNQTSSQDAIVDISYGNCFTFRNGVESSSVRDERFTSTLVTDLRPNLVLLNGYREIRFKNGLIYSGSFNENSSYTSLNEFNASRGNTKFVDLKYGSIQKVFARERDLVVFQEDQVSKILFGKNILNSPDGSGSLTQIEQVLGQTIPFTGEFGIAQNPESFAEYSGNIYFTDALRGAVLRLGTNGITPISDAGMTSYFTENLPQYIDKFNIGGYDPKNDQYALSLNSASKTVDAVTLGCGSQITKSVVAGTPLTYTVSIGQNPGSFKFKYVSDAAGSLAVTHNGSTTTSSITAGTGTITRTYTSSDISNDGDLSVSISPTSGTMNIQVEHECAAAGSREIIIIVLNDFADAGQTIINRYRVGTGPFYEKEDLFSTSEVARNETLVGTTEDAIIPSSGETITLSSLRLVETHSAFFNSTNRIGHHLSANTLTPDEAASAATFVTQTNTNTTTQQETTGTFTFSPTSDSEKLYLIFDYKTTGTPTDTSVVASDSNFEIT